LTIYYCFVRDEQTWRFLSPNVLDFELILSRKSSDPTAPKKTPSSYGPDFKIFHCILILRSVYARNVLRGTKTNKKPKTFYETTRRRHKVGNATWYLQNAALGRRRPRDVSHVRRVKVVVFSPPELCSAPNRSAEKDVTVVDLTRRANKIARHDISIYDETGDEFAFYWIVAVKSVTATRTLEIGARDEKILELKYRSNFKTRTTFSGLVRLRDTGHLMAPWSQTNCCDVFSSGRVWHVTDYRFSGSESFVI